MEFHVSKKVRDLCNFDESLFSFNGNVIFTNFKAVRTFAQKINATMNPVLESNKMIKAGQLNAMGLIDEIFHYICGEFRKSENPKAFTELYESLQAKLGEEALHQLLVDFNTEFPPVAVYQGKISIEDYLKGSTDGIDNKVSTVEEMMLLCLANENPAFLPFKILFDDEKLQKNKHYYKAWAEIQRFFKGQPLFGPFKNDLITMLREPSVFSPHSLKGQLDYIRQHWSELLGEWILRLLSGMDMISEEEKPGWSGHFSGPPPMDPYNFSSDSLMKEYERFSPDREWMPRVVLMAKTVLVWLDQLRKKYKRDIYRLDQIPDEELDALAQAGFTGLWLIGLWERSWASKRIKQICGNPEAAASAYSLHDYDIAGELGGWPALEDLRRRCWYRGIRLASDMVPNHTGMDSKWVAERPDLFVQTRDCPFPGYTFNGENLSIDNRISVYLEDHYYSKNDCAVVYKRVDNATGDTRYIYHGNDGTGMPWNDTAQIDFLNPEAREEVIQKILHVARNFPIIRFDAAMVLAKKHIKRLWYPEPGQGGDIASRAEHAMFTKDFEERIPNEFWREVVDRCAAEVPDTLLLAEAFWMMEGYFVRTLGMHRVYNSAFMNMLKREENQKYRDTVKNTIEFEPQILKRYVNFMNNPDEETAVAQFGRGDKYFGVCTLMVTMPGLPMFGHGQLEGFEEKYGMEYTKAYKDETPDYDLLERHKHDIFPLMKKRYLFSGVEDFFFYDVWSNGSVNENVFAYSNRYGDERAIVFYNNVYNQANGWIQTSCKYAVKDGDGNIHQETKNLCDALGLSSEPNTYLIFREHRTEKWYIRRISEIREKGMFLSLNGFEYQVLMDMSEVKDDATGKYGILCDTLNGAGVPDIEQALNEIFLKDLYKALSDFATRDFFVDMVKICNDGKNITKTIGKYKEKGLKYFETLVDFVNGNYGADTVLGKDSKINKTPAETAWKALAKNLSEFAKLTSIKNKDRLLLEKDVAALVKYLQSGFDSEYLYKVCFVAYLVCYSVKGVFGKEATSLDAKKLISLWHLDRKIRDILADCGYDSRASFEVFKTLIETTELCDCSLSKKDKKEVAYGFIKTLIENPYNNVILGINQFDNVLWYNKEKADFALWITVLQFAILALKKTETKALLDVKDLIAKSSEKSEYKVENFVALLKPAEKAVKAKKTPAKKAEKSTKKATEEKAEKPVKKATVKKTEAKKTTKKETTKKSTKK